MKRYKGKITITMTVFLGPRGGGKRFQKTRSTHSGVKEERPSINSCVKKGEVAKIQNIVV